MFRECSSLNYLYSSSFEINHMINTEKMFHNCSYFNSLKKVFIYGIQNDNVEDSIEKTLRDLLFEKGKILPETIENIIQSEKCDNIDKNSFKYEINNDNNNNIIITPGQNICQSEKFNYLNIDEFSKENKNDKLIELKSIIEDVVSQKYNLSKNLLDSKGNKIEGWSLNEKRGNKPYDPPIGWIGIGLNVIDKYEDNKWIGKSNSKGEWCVAYHGLGNFQSSDNIKLITGLIITRQFKEGNAQMHKQCEDIYHPGQKVGSGVYCTNSINFAEKYAGKLKINGELYKTVLMVRVKPEAIRHCSCSPYIWVVKGTKDEIRPYRILYKKYYI